MRSQIESPSAATTSAPCPVVIPSEAILLVALLLLATAAVLLLWLLMWREYCFFRDEFRGVHPQI